MNAKGHINSPVNYLPRLTDWINDKVIFWRTDLGSNILALNTPKNKNRRCFTISTAEPNDNDN